ncbi:MAG TPA: hypothetical protein ENI15_15400, partial [Spirochaetes bacterium]|nr:hypothetical protein [Spirochaetota bacterium]
MNTSFEKLREALMDISFTGQGAEGAEDVIDVEAYSVEEGLKRASETLGVNISDLKYEIVEQGKRSFLSKKPFRLAITVTKSAGSFDEDAFAELDEAAAAEVLKRDLDGVYRIKITRIGLMLKVTLPKGKGQRVSVEDVLMGIREKGVDEFDKSKVAKIVRAASEEYIKICDFEVDERSEGRIVVEISEDEMKAFMTLIPPKPRGRVLDIDDIHEALGDRNVVVGIMDDVI